MKKTLWATFLLALLVTGCGKEKAPETKTAVRPDGLTEKQIEYGIGPIESVTLGALDPELAKKGQEKFVLKCSACHKLDERLVGPPLRGVTQRRRPEFIMNMMLNPDEMVKKHPVVKKLLGEYFVPMTFQNITQEDARAILEYLRSVEQGD
jgi:mono/diheme cytochrome c family protein